jgi:hypothetical protein
LGRAFLVDAARTLTGKHNNRHLAGMPQTPRP